MQKVFLRKLFNHIVGGSFDVKYWDDGVEHFDEPFLRMWRVYLNSCIYGFLYRVVDVHEFLLEKGINNELPMTRHYLYE